MAHSIFPDLETTGAKIFRLTNGTCLLPLDAVHSTACPPGSYTSTCDLTTLPSNCDARIEPRQINAIVSELLGLAACMNPVGIWNCDSLNNLCIAFQSWTSANASGVIVSDVVPGGVVGNMLWWESDTGNLFLNYNDGSSTQWVQVAGLPVMDNATIVGSGIPSLPYQVGVIDCGTY
jgi:hypothetical protein